MPNISASMMEFHTAGFNIDACGNAAGDVCDWAGVYIRILTAPLGVLPESPQKWLLVSFLPFVRP